MLADTYGILLKGLNAWYGQMLAKGKGMVQVNLITMFYSFVLPMLKRLYSAW